MTDNPGANEKLDNQAEIGHDKEGKLFKKTWKGARWEQRKFVYNKETRELEKFKKGCGCGLERSTIFTVIRIDPRDDKQNRTDKKDHRFDFILEPKQRCCCSDFQDEIRMAVSADDDNERQEWIAAVPTGWSRGEVRGDTNSLWLDGRESTSAHTAYDAKCTCCFCKARREQRVVQGATAASKHGAAGDCRFMVRHMQIGTVTQALDGIWDAMRVKQKSKIKQEIEMTGLQEIEQEWRKECGHCNQADITNYNYIRYGTVKEELQKNGKTRDHGHPQRGYLRLEDFLEHPMAKKAELETEHVLALRLYSSNSYDRINKPLRGVLTREPTDDTLPHPDNPYPATTFYIREAVRKLRKCLDEKDFNPEEPKKFYRGMANMTVMDDFEKQGGTEMACMSTSEIKEEALKFAASKHPMLLQFEVETSVQCGADISWLSMYPDEKEWLFPPLTFLKFLKQSRDKLAEHHEESTGQTWHARAVVIHVRPVF